MYSWQLSNNLFKRINFKYVHNSPKVSLLLEHLNGRIKFGNFRKRIDLWFKQHGSHIARACTRQFEFIAAQRVRRSIQIFYLYNRIWDEVALREFMRFWKIRLLKNTRHVLIGAIGVTMYNWDHERISDNEIRSYIQEIEAIYRLKDSTVTCPKCHLRIVVDAAGIQPNIKYCECHDSKESVATKQDSNGWEPFIERKDMLIWRREEPNSGGLYSYKVYGSFPDVTAEDFLQVQVDVDYRKEWDTTARELQIIDIDPQSKTSNCDSCDVVYWEVTWPYKLFANRGYVYQRRWVVDKKNGLVIIISKGTNHPNAPCKSGTHRVTTYWSYMVIKPYKNFQEPGMEFGLTYFDDPGVRVPASITRWITVTGLSDFLSRMRQASKDYREYKIKQNVTTSGSETILGDDIPEHEFLDRTSNEKETDEHPSEMKEKINLDDKLLTREKFDFTQSVEQNTEESQDENNSTNTVPEEGQGFLSYFLSTKLFA